MIQSTWNKASLTLNDGEIRAKTFLPISSVLMSSTSAFSHWVTEIGFRPSVIVRWHVSPLWHILVCIPVWSLCRIFKRFYHWRKFVTQNHKDVKLYKISDLWHMSGKSPNELRSFRFLHVIYSVMMFLYPTDIWPVYNEGGKIFCSFRIKGQLDYFRNKQLFTCLEQL